MFCILHITDLHRAKSDPISNSELVSALIADRDRYVREDPPVARAQAIVVSGDIIQGVGLGQSGAEIELDNQYDSAYEFLAELAERFLEGDRAKVILVPGNHDIDWNCARSAMERVEEKDMPGGLPGVLYEPNSRYRWDWNSRELFFIKDFAVYEQRLAHFWRFFERFYNGASGLLRVRPWSDVNLYSLDEGRVGVAAFNSCVGNDCFLNRGEVAREAVAQAYLDLQKLGSWQLRIAVWHHDIEGPPNRSDYMDLDIVRGMIGRGFRLGLYGHQHRPQITPAHVYLPERETMAVVSAGSLCAGARELPTGARRGYSIIEIDEDYKRARVHVREMAVANLFSRANLPTFGGRSFADLEWTQPLDVSGRPENPTRERIVSALEKAELELRENNNPSKAIELIESVDGSSDPFGRRLMLEAIRVKDDPEQLIVLVGLPQSIEELVLGVDAYLRTAQPEEAREFLAMHKERLGLPVATRDELEKRISLMKRVTI